jgi:hypothetical protein
MILHKSIVISIITIVLSSCSSAINLAEQPSIATPAIGTYIQIGKYLEVTAPNGWNSFKTDDSISLEVRNISDGQITFGPDFGARIFVLTDESWVEVKNKITYKNDPLILDPSENYDPLKTGATIVQPELSDYSVPYDIRIFLIGDLIENGKAERKVSSYIDLKLSP